MRLGTAQPLGFNWDRCYIPLVLTMGGTTLAASDTIFLGTPQSTSAMQPGDVVDVEREHAGVLRNTVGPKQP